MTTRKAAATKRTATRKTPQDRKPSLRDQLAKKRAKVVTEYFPIDEDGEAAIEELGKLEGQLRLAEIVVNRNNKADVDIDGIKAKIKAAEQRRDDTCLMLRFRGLTEDERDALASSFGTEDVPSDATDEQRERILGANKEMVQRWTATAMSQAVLDSDLTADEWFEEIKSERWTSGDVLQIRHAIQEAYGARPADGIPKE